MVAGRIGNQVRWIFDDAGRIVGYRNPYNDAEVEFLTTAQVAALAAGSIPKSQILMGGTAGSDSGWLLIGPNPERLFWQLDSGTTSTQFTIDISADGSTSLAQAFTCTWAASATGEFTPPLMFSNPLARYFRVAVVSGGPLSVYRCA